MGKEKKPNAVVAPKRVVRQLTAAALQELASSDLGKAKYPIYLDFADSKFQLASLRGFSIVKEDAVKELNLADNCLTSVDRDSIPFTNLKRLWIPRNQISYFYIESLRKLDTLDLSRNRLAAIPDLSGCPELVVLNLSGNAICGSLEPLSSCRKLVSLDLSANDILWDPAAFGENVLILQSSCRKLEKLWFEKNPFCDYVHTVYRTTLISAMKDLLQLDGQAITKTERKEAQNVVSLKKSQSVADSVASIARGNDDLDDLQSVIDDDVQSDWEAGSSRSDSKSEMSALSGMSSLNSGSSLSSLGSSLSSRSPGPSRPVDTASEKQQESARRSLPFNELNVLIENLVDKDVDRNLAILMKVESNVQKKRAEWASQENHRLSDQELLALKELTTNMTNIFVKNQHRMLPGSASLLTKIVARLLLIPSSVVFDIVAPLFLRLLSLGGVVREQLLPTVDAVISPFLLRLEETLSQSADGTAVVVSDEEGIARSPSRFSMTSPAASVSARARLYFEVVEARNLRPSDANGLSDPYVVVNFETHKRESQRIERNLFPRWFFSGQFDVEDDHSTITFEIFDYDEFSDHDFLGRATLSLQDLQASDVLVDTWLPLEVGRYEDQVSGDVHVRMRLSKMDKMSSSDQEHARRLASMFSSIVDVQPLLVPIISVFVRDLIVASSEDAAKVLYLLLVSDPSRIPLLCTADFLHGVASLCKKHASRHAFRLLMHLARSDAEYAARFCSEGMLEYEPPSDIQHPILRQCILASLSSSVPAKRQWDAGQMFKKVIGYIADTLSSSSRYDAAVISDAFDALADVRYVWENIVCLEKTLSSPNPSMSPVYLSICRYFERCLSSMSSVFVAKVQDTFLAPLLDTSAGLGSERDEVRLAILRVTFSISTLSTRMLRSLVDFLFACQPRDMLQGRNEFVLASIIDALNVSKYKGKFSCEETVVEYLEGLQEAVLVVVTKIVRENTCRDTRGNVQERTQQRALSASCLEYLSSVEQCNKLGTIPAQCSEDLRQILLNEEKYSDIADEFSAASGKLFCPSLRFVEPPVDPARSSTSQFYGNTSHLNDDGVERRSQFIEWTFIASDVCELFLLLRDYVRPRSPVYVRLLYRIANLLVSTTRPISDNSAKRLINDFKIMDFVVDALTQCEQHASYYSNVFAQLPASGASDGTRPSNIRKSSTEGDVLVEQPDFASEFDDNFSSIEELLNPKENSEASTVTAAAGKPRAAKAVKREFLSRLRDSVMDMFDGTLGSEYLTDRSSSAKTEATKHMTIEEEWRRFADAERKPMQMAYHDQGIETHWLHLQPFTVDQFSSVFGALEGSDEDVRRARAKQMDADKNVLVEALFGNNVDTAYFYTSQSAGRFAARSGADTGEDGDKDNAAADSPTYISYSVAALLCVLTSCLECPAMVLDKQLRMSIYAKMTAPKSIGLLANVGSLCKWSSLHIGSLILRLYFMLLEVGHGELKLDEARANVYDTLIASLLSRAAFYLAQRTPPPVQHRQSHDPYEWLVFWFARVWEMVISHLPMIEYFNDETHFTDKTTLTEKLDVQQGCVRFFLRQRVMPFIPYLVHLLYSLDASNEYVFDCTLDSIQGALAQYCAQLLRRDQFALFEIVNRYLFLGHFPTIFVRPRALVRDLLARVQRQRFFLAIERLIYTEGLANRVDERVLCASWFSRLDSKVQFTDILVVCTTKRVLLFRKAIQVDCTVCPPEKFCPSPPRLAEDFDYGNIARVVRMYGSHVFSFTIDPQSQAFARLKLKGTDYTFGSVDPSQVLSVLTVLGDHATQAGMAVEDDRALDAMLEQIRAAVDEEREKEKERMKTREREKDKFSIVLPKSFDGPVADAASWFVAYIRKVNRRGKSQDRVLVVSADGVFNFAENTLLISMVDLSRSRYIMSLQSWHPIHALIRYEFMDGIDEERLGLKLWFLVQQNKKKPMVKFYDINFGSEVSRLRCVRQLEKLRSHGRWAFSNALSEMKNVEEED